MDMGQATILECQKRHQWIQKGITQFPIHRVLVDALGWGNTRIGNLLEDDDKQGQVPHVCLML